VSVPITTETGAGGFILPNDRVDVMSTVQVSDSPRRFKTTAVLGNIRVLAVDQTFKEDNNQKTVLAKTATLELTPLQAQLIGRAQASGALSLALRPLTASTPTSVAAALKAEKTETQSYGSDQGMSVIRYGVARVDNASQQKE
jgi:pilus assembly protein CpaB